jgi:hypothetical protein
MAKLTTSYMFDTMRMDAIVERVTFPQMEW